LYSKLNFIAKPEGLSIDLNTPDTALETLILELHAKYHCNVAVLIDEYDAPILSQIARPEIATEIRDAMGAFYAVLKDAEKWRGPTFITGVTKFTKASIFSSLNNLIDLTLNEDYADICGLTVKEFDVFFEDQMVDPDPENPSKKPRLLEKLISKGVFPKDITKEAFKETILAKYDGYSWDGQTRLLNPWSVLSLFEQSKFGDFWYDSGPPKFMHDLVTKDWRIYEIFKTDSFLTDSMNTIDVGNMSSPALLFQSGYLTIGRIESDSESTRYYLRFPNQEVEAAIYKLTWA
jgi:hypothetical protein